MREWFATVDLVGLPGLPGTVRNINSRAVREEWTSRPRSGRGGGREYHVSSLPSEAAAALLVRQSTPANSNQGPDPDGVWEAFERRPQKIRDEAVRRLKAVDAVEQLVRAGTARLAAVEAVARETGEHPATLRRWIAAVRNVPPSDRAPALAPRWSGRTVTAPCDPQAWAFFKEDYLRQAKPALEACYRRLQREASTRGWTIPSVKTLQRRIEREVPRPVIVLAREGEQALKRSFPSQRRDHASVKAMEAVNADGHRFDVFARWPDGTIARPVMVAVQDVHSGKILGWRIGQTETAELVRLAFADTVERFGIPDAAYLDNGRGFASKWITGGAPTRYRFQVRDDDPQGLLTLLGVETHWTQPYWGQAKPIERAFRDLCEDIAKHPLCEGAYCGNRPDARPENCSTALPIGEFTRLVETELAHHSARAGRRAPVCGGVKSFDQAFADSYAGALVRKATEAQRRLMLLAAASIGCDRLDGAVRLLGNRYWSEPLAQLAGRRVTVRFDPQALDRPVHVYGLDGRYLASAERIEASGFGDVEAARKHQRARRDYVRSAKAMEAAEKRMAALDPAALLERAAPPAELPETRVVRGVFPAARPAAEPRPSQDDFDRQFEKGLALLSQQRRKGGVLP